MLTSVEVALCRDALLEAGVPLRVVDELTTPRVRYTGKTRTLRAARSVPNRFEEGNESVLAEARRYLYDQIVQHLIDSGITQVVERVDPNGTNFLSLDVTVVMPK